MMMRSPNEWRTFFRDLKPHTEAKSGILEIIPHAIIRLREVDEMHKKTRNVSRVVDCMVPEYKKKHSLI